MIRVSVNPDSLVAGQSSMLTIRLSNTGLDACSDVVFRLKLPSGMALVSGRDRIDVDEILARQVHVHQVTVLPGRPGDVEVGTSNFSYRDEDGITRRQDDWRAPIRVLAAGPPQGGAAQASSSSPSRPPPRLTLSHGGGKLALDEWDVLEVFVRNGTGVPLHDITLTLAGRSGLTARRPGSSYCATARQAGRQSASTSQTAARSPSASARGTATGTSAGS